MTAPTEEEILNKYVGGTSVDTLYHDRVHYIILAMKEYGKTVASLSWEASLEYGYRSNFGKVPTDAPDKESFMKTLFKEEKVKL